MAVAINRFSICTNFDRGTASRCWERMPESDVTAPHNCARRRGHQFQLDDPNNLMHEAFIDNIQTHEITFLQWT